MENIFIYRKKVEVAGELGALITVPEGFDPSKESLPLIVFLHGAGERGDIDESFFDAVTTHGIPKYFTRDTSYGGSRVITFSPRCPENMIWNHLVFPLKEMIDEFADEYNADKSNITVTGLSMGGYGTWEMITTFPGYFRRAAPICGGGVTWRTRCLSGMDIMVVHGLDDEAVMFENSLIMVQSARKNGANVRFIAIDGVGHGSWVYAYEQTDMISWLIRGE